MTRLFLGLIAVSLLLAGSVSGGDAKARSAGAKRIVRQVSFGPSLALPDESEQDLRVAPRRIARAPEPHPFAPGLIRETAQVAPPPDPSPMPIDPPPMPVDPMSVPHGDAPYVEEVVDGPSVPLLYPHVKYHDLKDVHPCAVVVIVAVPNPCRECGCVYVKICVPPNCRPKISRKGNEIEYDYGNGYEVEIKWRDGIVHVDYDD